MPKQQVWACRQLGFDFGVLSPSPCGQYGGGSWCGAAGSPVAVKSLKCSGTEISVDECSSEPVDDACMSHGSDAVVLCGASSVEAFPDGELRLIGPAGAPALPGEAGRLEIFLATSEAWAPVCRPGFTSGSAAVACKQMGFYGGLRLCKLPLQGGVWRSGAAAVGVGLRRIGDKRAAMPHGGRGRCVLRARRVRAVDLCWAWRPYRQAHSRVNADWLPRLRLLPTDRSDRDRAFCARGATSVA